VYNLLLLTQWYLRDSKDVMFVYVEKKI